MKYEILKDQSCTIGSIKLFRIRALEDIGLDVKAGDLGGFVQGPDNLSQLGDCWVFDNACVFGCGRVCDDAQIRHNVWVFGAAIVGGDARVSGSVSVYGQAHIVGAANVCGDFDVCGGVIGGNETVAARKHFRIEGRE